MHRHRIQFRDEPDGLQVILPLVLGIPVVTVTIVVKTLRFLSHFSIFSSFQLPRDVSNDCYRLETSTKLIVQTVSSPSLEYV